MNWDTSFENLIGKKSAPKQGRRAGNPRTPENVENLLDSALESIGSRSPPEAPVRTRKSGGWADEGTKLKNKGNSNLIEQERFQEQKSESDDDIPIIPDIEEIQDFESSSDDIKTPIVHINKDTYKELDAELFNLQKNQVHLGKLTDDNLLALTKHLSPEEDVLDPDEIWTMESLFDDIKSMSFT